MEAAQKFRDFTRIIIVAIIAVLLIVVGLQSLPLYAGSDLQLIYLVSDQEWISQRIAKDALLMHDGTMSQRVQAVNELQVMLPAFDSNQAMLQRARGLHTDAALLLRASITYDEAIDAAVRAILAHPDTPADPVQVQIIQNNELPYFRSFFQIQSVLQEQIHTHTIAYFVTEAVFDGIILLLVVGYFIKAEGAIRSYLDHVAQEGKKQE